MYIYIHIHIYICTCICICIYIYICIYVNIYVYIHIQVYIYICIYMYMARSVVENSRCCTSKALITKDIHAYICTCIFIYIYTYTYIPALQDAEDFGFAGLLFCNNTVGLDLCRYLFEIWMACAQAASLFEQGGCATIVVANCIVVRRSPKSIHSVDYY